MVSYQNLLRNYSFAVNRLYYTDYNKAMHLYYPESDIRTDKHRHDFPQLWYCMKRKKSALHISEII